MFWFPQPLGIVVAHTPTVKAKPNPEPTRAAKTYRRCIMKSLRNNTLVMAVAMTLWATTSMAGESSNLPVGSSEKDITATAASSAPLHALSRLEDQTLADQEMTDQELKAVEGGTIYQTLLAAKNYASGLRLEIGEATLLSTTVTLQGSCTCTCTP
jgi:hypothetical protein